MPMDASRLIEKVRLDLQIAAGRCNKEVRGRKEAAQAQRWLARNK